jgi:hypothetical protein
MTSIIEYEKEMDNVENYWPSSREEQANWQKFFTEKILKWISKETDAYRLSLTSHLLNCHVWPSWLPDMPNYFYSEKEKCLSEQAMLMHILKRKSDNLSPGIYNMTWATKLYQNHPEYKKHYK